MRFSENIKTLRKQKGLTQEELAEQLNISFQTVSKWENGVSMPDIALLPVLAECFSLSIDELLGYHAEDRRIRSAGIAKQAHALADAGDLPAAYRYLEAETRYFKMDIGLQNLLGVIAYQCAKTATGEEKNAYLRTAMQQADHVLRLDRNDTSRTAQAKLLRCYCLKEMGNCEAAAQQAHKLPSLFSSREVALFRCTEGEEKRRYAAALDAYLVELRTEVAESL